jgi:hypothetical protein
LVLGRFSLDLTSHIATLLTFLPCSLFYLHTAPPLVPYLLSPTDKATLITSYPIDLATVLTTYPTNLATLLITYPTLKTYPKCNTCILGHFKSTHVGFKFFLYKDPTLNAIPAFWAISKVRMWGSSFLYTKILA